MADGAESFNAAAAPDIARQFRMAAARGHVGEMKALLAAGADVDSRDATGGETALIMASWNGHAEAAEFLIDQGADKNAYSSMYFTPLGIALAFHNRQVAELLLKKGADPNIKMDFDFYPIHSEASEGNDANIRLLLSHKADASLKDKSGQTALYLAAANGRLPALKTLYAALPGMLDEPDTLGLTPLMKAAREGHNDCLDYLLAQGASLAATDKSGLSPLSHAAACGNIHALESMLRQGVPVDAPDGRGMTALMHASGMGREKTMTFLLGKGADPSAREPGGFRAHEHAIVGKQQGVIRILDDEIHRRHVEAISHEADKVIAGGTPAPVKAMKGLKLRRGR